MHDEIVELAVGLEVRHGHVAGRLLAQADQLRRIVGQ